MRYAGYIRQAGIEDGVPGWWMQVVRTEPLHEGLDYQNIDWLAEPAINAWMRADEFEDGSDLHINAYVEIDVVDGKRVGRRGPLLVEAAASA